MSAITLFTDTGGRMRARHGESFHAVDFDPSQAGIPAKYVYEFTIDEEYVVEDEEVQTTERTAYRIDTPDKAEWRRQD